MRVRLISRDTNSIHDYPDIPRVRVEEIGDEGIYYILEQSDGTNSYRFDDWDIQFRKEEAV